MTTKSLFSDLSSYVRDIRKLFKTDDVPRELLKETVRVLEKIHPDPSCPFCADALDIYPCSTCYELSCIQGELIQLLKTIKTELEKEL